MTKVTFYFDLGSPFAYLAAERMSEVFPGPVSEPSAEPSAEPASGPSAEPSAEPASGPSAAPIAWQPVSLGALFKLNGRSSWALSDPATRQAGMAEVERRASRYGLPPLRWPDPWPTNYLFAMRVATYAFQMGRGREFTMQAFRQAFQHGHDLAVQEHVLEAAGKAGLDTEAAADAAGDPEIKLALRAATDAAHGLGVFGVPTIAVGEELFWGEDRLGDAAACLRDAAARQDRPVG
jgi:2-hydroxychromene-2-carboxylate isomerase